MDSFSFVEKCSQEVIAIGASWLDIFSRSVDDITDGAGLPGI